MVRWRRVGIVAGIVLLFVLVAAFAAVQIIVTGIAKDNLTNAEFEREHSAHPNDFGMAYQDIVILSDGLELAGWWIPSQANGVDAPTVILVHGFSAEMGKVLKRWGPNLYDAGYAILTFDLRNHGQSDDGPSHYVTYGATEMRDVLAAIEFVRDNAPELRADPDRIALYGASMGAVSVLSAVATDPEGVDSVIFDSGYASLRFQARLDGAEQGYPRFLVDQVVTRMDELAPGAPSSVAPEKIIGSVTVPLLLAHCSNDTRVDAVSHPRLARRAPTGTEAWFQDCPVGLSEEHHVDGWMLPQYNATVRAFLNRTLGPVA